MYILIVCQHYHGGEQRGLTSFAYSSERLTENTTEIHKVIKGAKAFESTLGTSQY